ncbi:MAG: OsmC family protein [Alphaproteobacteria bacterium]|nr:OsmC family protein [Alphaproteobacteria bacterium]
MAHTHRYRATLTWTGAAKGPTTDYESYSRECRIEIPGKPPLIASADPTFRGDPALTNPEDMLVAALVSCHALSYLALAARVRIPVLAYRDEATGTMDMKDGRIRFVEVVLHPRVTIAAGADAEKARALHHKAHDHCFIANSVNFPVRHEPAIAVATG